MTPSHYLNHHWLLINETLWHSPECKSTACAWATILYNEFENYTFKIMATSARGQWVNVKWNIIIDASVWISEHERPIPLSLSVPWWKIHREINRVLLHYHILCDINHIDCLVHDRGISSVLAMESSPTAPSYYLIQCWLFIRIRFTTFIWYMRL